MRNLMQYLIGVVGLVAGLLTINANAYPVDWLRDSVDSSRIYRHAHVNGYFSSADEACLIGGNTLSGDKGQYADIYAGGTAGLHPDYGHGCYYHFTRTNNTTGEITDENPQYFGQGWVSVYAACPQGYTLNAEGVCSTARSYADNSCPIKNPIYPAKGNKSQYEVDYLGSTLQFSRQYASWNQGEIMKAA